MSFKENLLKKIEIDELAERVRASVGPPDSGKKVDKAAMRRLLGLGPFEKREKRDLELYVREERQDGGPRILVLDDALGIYHTDAADVALRKSPTVKEMINIKNAIKILNDGDVLKSKKEESVEIVREECIATLDLDYAESDIEEIASDGRAALENEDQDGVLKTLELFAELLDLSPAPKAFRPANFEVLGKKTEDAKGEVHFGPAILYGVVRNELKLVEKTVGSRDREALEALHAVATGKEKASVEGGEVFFYLKNWVMRK